MLKRLLVTAAALVAVVGIVKGAGLFWGYPIVGGSSYCVTYQNQQTNNLGVVTSQGTCVATAPAGPATVTGNELLIADTQLPGTQQPQTVYMPVSVMASLGQGSDRNALVGGDFVTNLWQRGTTFTALTPTTTTLTADRWAVYSSGNTVTVTRDITAADVLPSAGVNGIMKVTRPSGTNTTSICVGQVLPSAESARFIGNEAVFSFYAEALAGYLQTNSTIQAVIAVYTAADSATPLTNTDTFFKGTITGYTVLNPATVSTVAVPVTSNTTLPAGFPITTSLVRYSVSAYVPTQVLVSSTLTNVLGIGVEICTGTYPASTGVATDGFGFGNAQLEATSAGTAVNGVLVAAPNTAPGSFARRTAAEEAILQYSYTQPAGLGTEVATVYASNAGSCTASGNANFGVNFVPPLRAVPTSATSTLTAGGWSIKTAAAVTAIGTMTIVGASKSSATLNSTAACTTTLPYVIVGSNTTGLILFVAEP